MKQWWNDLVLRQSAPVRVVQLSAVVLCALSLIAVTLNPVLVSEHKGVFATLFGLAAVAIGHSVWFGRTAMNKTFTTPTDWRPIHTIGLIVVAVVMFGVMQFRLGQAQFFEDEFQVMNTASGYLYTHSLYQWDWRYQASGQQTLCADVTLHCHYTRAVPHTWLIDQSYLWFGISEWSTRLPSVLGGVATALVLFGLWYHLTRRYSFALLVAMLVPLLPPFLIIFRTARMYALLIPITLGLWWAVLVWWQRWTSPTTLRQWSVWWPLVVATLLAGLDLSLHSLTIIVIMSTWWGLITLLFFTRRYRAGLNILVVTQTLFATALLIWFFVLNRPMSELFGWLTPPHWEYLRFIFGQVIHWQYGALALVALCVLFVSPTLPQRFRLGIVFQYKVIGVAAVCFVFLLQRYASFNYSAVFTALATGLIVVAASLLSMTLQSPWRVVFATGSLLLLLYTQQPAWQGVYTINSETPDLRSSYQTIQQLFEPGDVIFGQYLRWYYLQGLPTDTAYIDLGFQKQYSFDRFLVDSQHVERFWVTWESRKGYHLVPGIKHWVAQHCTHYHGTGIDQTHVEVYVCQQEKDIDKTSN